MTKAIAKNNSNKKNKPMKVLFFSCIVALSFVSLGGFIVALFGCLPTMTAWYRDSSKRKAFGYSVAIVNIPCVLLVLKDIVPLGQNLTLAMPYVKNSLSWLFIYCGAGIGWWIYTATPKLVIKVLSWKFNSKIAELKRKQDAIVEQWGLDVVD